MCVTYSASIDTKRREHVGHLVLGCGPERRSQKGDVGHFLSSFYALYCSWLVVIVIVMVYTSIRRNQLCLDQSGRTRYRQSITVGQDGDKTAPFSSFNKSVIIIPYLFLMGLIYGSFMFNCLILAIISSAPFSPESRPRSRGGVSRSCRVEV